MLEIIPASILYFIFITYIILILHITQSYKWLKNVKYYNGWGEGGRGEERCWSGMGEGEEGEGPAVSPEKCDLPLSL